MSLFGAMNTAISGIAAQSAAFSNIGDNVANSQTIGFKRTDTSFEDYLTNSNALINDSGSVVARPQYVNDVQGTITQTDLPLGVAIAGGGFFQVSRATTDTGGVTGFSPQTMFTRAGDFALNKEGYIVNSEGDYLNAWKADSKGAIDRTAISPVQVNQAAYSPVATSSVALSANLPATPGNNAISSQVEVYDALGTAHTVQLSWAKSTTAANTWTVTMTAPDAQTPALGTADVVFGSTSGTAAPAGTVGTVTANSAGLTGSTYVADQPATLGFNADFGSGTQPITLNLGTFGQPNGLTQYAGTDYSLRSLTQDGVPPGSFSRVEVKNTGDIVANYDNAQSRVIGRIPVSTFAAADSLQRQDGQTFTATTASGPAQAKDAGAAGAGTIATGSLESSNVDIGKEFTKLITAQRAYSANTKMVTTADDLLQQTIDMKR